MRVWSSRLSGLRDFLEFESLGFDSLEFEILEFESFEFENLWILASCFRFASMQHAAFGWDKNPRRSFVATEGLLWSLLHGFKSNS